MRPAALFLFAAVAACSPTVYLIRHGEKPDDDDITGLSTEGKERAQCLRSVFGASSSYNIGYIMAQAYKSGKEFLACPNTAVSNETRWVEATPLRYCPASC